MNDTNNITRNNITRKEAAELKEENDITVVM